MKKEVLESLFARSSESRLFLSKTPLGPLEEIISCINLTELGTGSKMHLYARKWGIHKIGINMSKPLSQLWSGRHPCHPLQIFKFSDFSHHFSPSRLFALFTRLCQCKSGLPSIKRTQNTVFCTEIRTFWSASWVYTFAWTTSASKRQNFCKAPSPIVEWTSRKGYQMLLPAVMLRILILQVWLPVAKWSLSKVLLTV